MRAEFPFRAFPEYLMHRQLILWQIVETEKLFSFRLFHLQSFSFEYRITIVTFRILCNRDSLCFFL